MRGQRVAREALAPDLLDGRVLTRDLRDAGGRIAFRKGQVLHAADVEPLARLPWDELHLIEMEDGDLHEDYAGRRLAAAAVGDGVAVGELSGGAWPLRARWRGILDVDVDALTGLNSVGGISVYTLYRGQVVEEGETVARAKIIPLVIEGAKVEEAEAAVGENEGGGVIRVRPFLPHRVAAVVQDTLGPGQMSRFRDVLGEKIAWFGSELMEPIAVGAAEDALADALARVVEEGAGLVVMAGSKPMDPLDPAFGALGRLGVSLERHGVPAHPGSLFWIARLRGVPILGMPNCGLFSKATVFDLVLPRILAGDSVARAELAELGHGGFLTRDMAFRFPPYRPSRERGEVPSDDE
jgi:hypothetical protein